MPRFNSKIEIDAPRDHVFARIADVTKHPEWCIFTKECVITSGDGKSAGTTDKRMIKVASPFAQELQDTWIEYVPGEVFARSFTGYLNGTERISLSANGDATRVVWEVDYKPPYGIIGKIGAFVMMARVFQNDIESSLENLKRELEI